MIVAALVVAAAAAALPIDHVILGVADLDQGVAEVERRTGAKLVAGGSHPGLGTRNALMSLGDGTYLEVMAPDPAQAKDDADIRELKALKAPTPVGWAMRTDDAPGLVARLSPTLKTATIPGSRTKADGTRLDWTLVVLPAIGDPLAPFFIAWDTMTTHPSRTSPGGCSLAALSIDTPDPARLQPVAGLAAKPVALRRQAPPRLHLDLDCPAGKVSF